MRRWFRPWIIPEVGGIVVLVMYTSILATRNERLKVGLRDLDAARGAAVVSTEIADARLLQPLNEERVADTSDQRQSADQLVLLVVVRQECEICGRTIAAWVDALGPSVGVGASGPFVETWIATPDGLPKGDAAALPLEHPGFRMFRIPDRGQFVRQSGITTVPLSTVLLPRSGDILAMISGVPSRQAVERVSQLLAGTHMPRESVYVERNPGAVPLMDMPALTAAPAPVQ